MSIWAFTGPMDRAAVAVERALAVLRHIHTARGDLPYRDLDMAQEALREAKVASLAILTRAATATNVAAAEAHMASLGGPATMAEFTARVTVIEGKSASWNTALAACLAGLGSAGLPVMVTRTVDGISTQHIERPHAIPGVLADPLRTSTELAELAAAFFEAVGA